MSGTATPVEMLDGGLNNVRDRSLLRPGELSRANNVFYKPHDPALHKHPGRVKYDSTAAAPGEPIGLRYLEYDSVDPKLVRYSVDAGAGKLAVSALAAETGAFSAITPDVGVGPTMDSVYGKQRHMLLFGAATDSGDLFGPNQVVTPDGGVRRHGLAPVVSPPELALVTGAWPNNEEFPLGWYFFITTEQNEESDIHPFFLESAWEGEAMAGILINDPAKSIEVTFPALVNTGANSAGVDLIQARRVYMAGPIGETDPVQAARPQDPPLSAFRLVAQEVVGTASTTVGGISLANLNVADSASGTFTNPTDALTDNNDGAVATADAQTLSIQDFDLATTGSLAGIYVEIKARYLGVIVPFPLWPQMIVQLLDAAGNPTGTAKTINVDSRDWKTYNRGSNGDLWGSSITAADTTNALFGVRITSNMPHPTDSPDFEVDVVRVRALADGGDVTIPLGQDFPYVTIPIGGGTAALYPSHSQPPTASTGDNFEGCTVLNDVEKPGDAVWSLPGEPEYFPKPYRLTIDPKQRDEITCIRTLGDLVLVGMKKQLWRVHKLPREEDSFFDTTRIKERISADKGVVNCNAMQIISTPGQPEIAVFFGLNGLHYTNGHLVDSLISAINWEETVNVDMLDVASLTQYPKYSILAFDYVPAGDEISTRPTKRLIIHYHPSQIDATGKMKVLGPVDLPAVAQDLAWFGNKPLLVSFCEDGFVYVEDRGWQDGANADSNLVMSVLTRDFYPAGVGHEATFERVWWRRGKYDDPQITLVVTPWVKKTGDDYFTPVSGQRWTPASKTRTALTGAPLPGDILTVTNAGVLERVDAHFLCESFALEFETSETNNGFTLSYIVMEISSKGISDNA